MKALLVFFLAFIFTPSDYRIIVIIIAVLFYAFYIPIKLVNGTIDYLEHKYDERTNAIRDQSREENMFIINNEPKPKMIRKRTSRITKEGNKELEEVVEDY